ncbi:MAG: 4Fe-4S binding protein [Leptolinea sp.]|jgi:2-oxoglutarate ferredoxin oxidoreductase subunit delta|nr:4Fe-4S binding protein [Leptolinea sp.]
MSHIVVNKELCKSCGLCVTQCPKKILRISAIANSKGYFVCEQTDASLCIACNFCAYVCPDAAITVFKEAALEGAL